MTLRIKIAAKVVEELNQISECSDMKKKAYNMQKQDQESPYKKKWGKKNNGRKVNYNVDRQLLSEEDTLLWLLRRYIKAGTETELIAAQDEALQNKYHEKNIEIPTLVKTMTRHQTTLCQLTQYWQKNNKERLDSVF